METMYDRIKKLRKKRNWTQSELANKVGYADKTAIAKIESGKIDIPQSKIVAFAEAFSVSTSYLMDGSDFIEECESEEMEKKISRKDYVTSLVDKYLKTDNEHIRNTFIALGELSEDEWKLVQNFIDILKDASQTKSSASDIPSSPEELEKKYPILEHQNSEDKTAG